MRTAGQNGGALGADNPTYHASIGWDWIPTIRGRDTGIVGKCLPHRRPEHDARRSLRHDCTAAAGHVARRREHRSRRAQPRRATGSGTLRGRFGEVRFEQRVSLDAAATDRQERSSLIPPRIPALRLKNPKLWWPVGYGDPHLYDVESEVRGGRWQVIRHQGLQGGHPPDDLQRRWRRAARSGSTAGGSSREAATGDSASRCFATVRANMTPPCATTAR